MRICFTTYETFGGFGLTPINVLASCYVLVFSFPLFPLALVRQHTDKHKKGTRTMLAMSCDENCSLMDSLNPIHLTGHKMKNTELPHHVPFVSV